MLNEDSIDESVGAHPTYVHFSDLEKVVEERDLWRETAEAYKFTINKLAEELSQMKTKLQIADSTITSLRKFVDLCILFEHHYVCESCSEKAGTYLQGCPNPLHRIHDAVYEMDLHLT